MLGGYIHMDNGDLLYWNHSTVLIIHVLIANVFMVNYLVAILSTTYENMLPGGSFAYQSNRYKYIERYKIAMKDPWGYEELVVHAPGPNFLTVFLFGSIFSPGSMQGTAKVFAKLIFWIENFFYISHMLLVHFILMIFCFFKLTVNIARIAKPVTKIPCIIAWLILGPFYMIYALFKDMYYYIKILCDSKEDDNALIIRQEEDKLQDKICIYNEIIDTLRAVCNLHRLNYKQLIKKVRKPNEKMAALKMITQVEIRDNKK
jgi:hypothetical protein